MDRLDRGQQWALQQSKHSWLHWEKCCQQAKGGDAAPLHLCRAELPAEERSGHSGADPVRDRKIIKELEKLTDRERFKRVWSKEGLGGKGQYFLHE